MTTVLITGGAGFIGRQLASQLIANGYDVRIIDPLAPQVHGALPQNLAWLDHPRIHFFRGSVLDKSTVRCALGGVSHVVHLAAETGTGQSMYDIANYNSVNTQGTAILLDELANNPTHKVTRFILASSRSVYGDGPYMCRCSESESARQFPQSRSSDQLRRHQWDPLCLYCGAPMIPVPTIETDKISPASIYAATKHAQEELVRIGCSSLGIDYAILRLQNVYGAGQSLGNPYTGILSIFSTRIRHGRSLPIFEDGLESRDFVHVSDVARAFLLSVSCASQLSAVINVGSGLGTSVLDIAKLLISAFDSKVPIEITSEYRIGDIRHNIADISRLQSLLAFAPDISLVDGINSFVEWVAVQKLPSDRLDEANAELRTRRLMA